MIIISANAQTGFKPLKRKTASRFREMHAVIATHDASMPETAFVAISHVALNEKIATTMIAIT